MVKTERAGHARDIMDRITKDELNALDGVVVVVRCLYLIADRILKSVYVVTFDQIEYSSYCPINYCSSVTLIFDMKLSISVQVEWILDVQCITSVYSYRSRL